MDDQVKERVWAVTFAFVIGIIAYQFVFKSEPYAILAAVGVTISILAIQGTVYFISSLKIRRSAKKHEAALEHQSRKELEALQESLSDESDSLSTSDYDL